MQFLKGNVSISQFKIVMELKNTVNYIVFLRIKECFVKSKINFCNG